MIDLGPYAYSIILSYIFTILIIAVLVLQTIISFFKYKKILARLVDKEKSSK